MCICIQIFMCVHIYAYIHIVSALRPLPTIHRPELGPREPYSFRNDWTCLGMRLAVMTCQRFTELLGASLGSLRGSWEVLGHPLGVVWRLVESPGFLGGPSGFPLGVPGGPRGPRESQGVIGEVQGGTEIT